MLQPAQDASADASHILVTEGFVAGLVGEAVGQAFSSGANFFAAIDIEQTHIADDFSTGLADELGNPFGWQCLVHHQGQIFEYGREFRDRRGLGKSRDESEKRIQIQLGCQDLVCLVGNRPVEAFTNLWVQLAENADLCFTGEQAGAFPRMERGVLPAFILGIGQVQAVNQA